MGSLTETAINTVLEKESVTSLILVELATPVTPTKSVVSMNLELTKPTETITLPKAGEQRVEATLLSLLGAVMGTRAVWFIRLSNYRRQINRN